MRVETQSSTPKIKLNNLNGLAILVVDDNADNRFLLSRQLINHGASARAASSGKEALSLIDEIEFDLIVLDLNMPGMDGFVTAWRLREAGFEKPIILLTASGHDVIARMLQSRLFSQVLQKPQAAENLVAELSRLRKTSWCI